MEPFQHKLSRKLLCLCTTSCFEELNVEEFSHGNCVSRYISKYSLHSFDKTKLCSFVSSRLLLYGQILLWGQWKMDKEFDRSGTLEITRDLKSQIFLKIILNFKGEKNYQPTSIFVHLHPFSVVIHGLLYFIIQPLFEDECLIIVECRQICLNDFFIFQTKLKITGKIKLWHSSGFPCFGKHYIAKSVHCVFV